MKTYTIKLVSGYRFEVEACTVAEAYKAGIKRGPVETIINPPRASAGLEPWKWRLPFVGETPTATA
jgi:hypothetical protein